MRTLAAGYAIWARATVVDVQVTLCAKLRSEKARNGLFSRLATSMHDPLRALKRLEHIGEWRSLRTWKAWTDAASAAEERRAVAATKALSTLCRVEGRFLRLGWRTWTLFCRASLKCERLCKRWTHAVAWSAWWTWTQWCAYLRNTDYACRVAGRVASRFRHVAFSAALRTWIDVTRWDEVCKVRAGAAASRIRMLLGATALHCVTVAWRTWVGRISLFQRLDEVDNMNSRDGAARAVRILCDLQCPKPCHSVVQSVLRSSPPTPPTPPKKDSHVRLVRRSSR